MKFIETGTIRNNYLNEKTTLKVAERIENILLRKLDYFIEFITKEKPDKINELVDNLVDQFQRMRKADFWKNTSNEIKGKFDTFKNLKSNKDLKQAALNYFVHLLQIEYVDDWVKDEIEISKRGLIQAWTFPSYYMIKTLAETIGREEAIKLYKKFITQFHINHTSPQRFIDLKTRFEERTSGDTTSSEWVIVHTMLEEGKYAFKNKNCPTCADVSVNLPDVEFKYLAFCYGDYAAFRARMSDDIILTMEHTIIQGDSYCSRVMHDTRYDWDLKHPSKEFWDRLEPGNEEEALKYYK